MKEPCIDCKMKRVDDWGYLCDIACGKRTSWLNHQDGIKEVVEWIETKSSSHSNGKLYVFTEAMWQAQLKVWEIE